MKTLKEMKPGEIAVVKKVHGEGSLRRRILDMGIIRGTQLEMVKKAPLGDPIEVKIKGYDLSLRQTEAALVEVE
ncbi:MAG: ferrous iron transport protein A [Chloroflexi bacterium]|jgi:ferrous iron transport protein A|nr:ferrous iron transport protein A [Chloroflexota bacterium]